MMIYFMMKNWKYWNKPFSFCFVFQFAEAFLRGQQGHIVCPPIPEERERLGQVLLQSLGKYNAFILDVLIGIDIAAELKLELRIKVNSIKFRAFH